MEKIAFKDWRLIAAVDTEILKLDVDALDGSDILLMNQAGQSGGCDGEPYVLRFSTQRIESAHEGAPHGRPANLGDDNDDNSAPWGADEDETLYLRGWEITALVDEEGLLNVEVQKGDEADIFPVEALESGASLSSHISVRLAAEASADDDDEDADDDLDDDYDHETRRDPDEDFDELDELDEHDDEEDDDLDESDAFSPYDDLFDRDDDDRY